MGRVFEDHPGEAHSGKMFATRMTGETIDQDLAETWLGDVKAFSMCCGCTGVADRKRADMWEAFCHSILFGQWEVSRMLIFSSRP